MKKITLATLLILGLTACGIASILSVIDAALPIAIQLASATGVLPAGAAIPIGAALDCISFASTELAGTDSNAQKSATITAACLASASLALPAGTPQNYVNLANKLATYISELLSKLPPQAVAGSAPRAAPPIVVLTDAQRAHLLDVSDKALHAKLAMQAGHPSTWGVN